MSRERRETWATAIRSPCRQRVLPGLDSKCGRRSATRNYGLSSSFSCSSSPPRSRWRGGGSSAHIPHSVSVSAASADAKDFSGGPVQFTATASYETMPSPVTRGIGELGAAVSSAFPSDAVSIATHGAAQCASAAKGIYLIYAFVANPAFHGLCGRSSSACGGTCGGVVGGAQLTCP
jgi:hypothetical protein